MDEKRIEKPVYILNGPNLNLLGTREPQLYGHQTLEEIERKCASYAEASGFKSVFRQSNHEGVLVDWVQEARDKAQALVINGGAYSHTSIALYDALKSLTIPIVEVHLSQVYTREPFRHKSYISKVASGVICGFGAFSYLLALEALGEIFFGNTNEERRSLLVFSATGG